MDLRQGEKDKGEDNHRIELKVTELIGWKLCSCVHTDVICLVFRHFSSRKWEAFEISVTKKELLFVCVLLYLVSLYLSFLLIYLYV
jgi:hypothetical protein